MKTGSLGEETIKRLLTPAKGNSITYFAGATIQGAKAPRGFGIRVTASGARAFILNYRLRGREHRFTMAHGRIGRHSGRSEKLAVCASASTAAKTPLRTERQSQRRSPFPA
jgi:hypothetical protein